MAEVKLSQAHLPSKFPTISPPKPYGESPIARRTRSRRTVSDRDSYDHSPNMTGIGGRPGTPTSAAGTELPKLVHLDPQMLDNDPKRAPFFGRDATGIALNVSTASVYQGLSVPSPLLTRAYTQIPGTKNKTKMQNFARMARSLEGGKDSNLPMPYQGSYFKSSTILRMVTIPRRHPDTFGEKDSLFYNKKKSVILHTDRYQWEDHQKIEEQKSDKQSQRDRLEAELEHVEKVKGIKRCLGSALPHRMDHDLLMGGKKVEFAERVDINGELAHLRAMVLPADARDLYIGKGIGSRLPRFHQVNKPRGPPVPEPPSTSAPAALNRIGTKIPNFMPPVLTLAAAPSNNTDKMFKRECTCLPLPSIPRQTKVRKRKRKSVDDTDIKYGEILDSDPKLDDDNENPGDIPECLALPKPNPTLTVNNIKFVSPAQPDAPLSDVRQSWPKEEDEGAESEVEIELPPPDATEQEPEKPEVPRMGASTGSPIKAVTPNPFKNAGGIVEDTELDALRSTFKRLDTDADGHLLYQQVKTQLPNSLSSAEERFLKQVYDITSASTYFGVQEFTTMTALIKKFEKFGGTAREAYNHVDMMNLKDTIIQYIELFQAVDRMGKGKISIESVEEILCTTLGKDSQADGEYFKEVFEVIKPDEEDSISKLTFLLHIPYLKMLEDRLKNGKP